MIQPQVLLDQQAYEEILQDSGPVLIFKFSPWCPVSHYAEAEAKAFLAGAEGFVCGTVDVIKERPLARGIAEWTGIRHESPQALLFVQGKVVWHESHAEVNRESLAAAIQKHMQASA